MKHFLFFLFLTSILFAKNECSDRVFERFSASKQASIYSALEQISAKCGLTIITKDDETKDMLEQKAGIANLKNFTLEHFLNILLAENNLNHELDGDILRISFVATKSFKMDYIATNRSSYSGIQTNGSAQQQIQSVTNQSNNSSAQQTTTSAIGTNITTNDNFDFYAQIESELRAVIAQTRVVQSSTTEQMSHTTKQLQIEPKQSLIGGVIVNKNANLITVTGTKDELDRVEKYLKTLTNRLHQQVLIDVNIYSVSLDSNKVTGVDWGNIFSFLNATISVDAIKSKNITAFDTSSISSIDSTKGIASGEFFRISSAITLKDIVKFLDTQGKVKSISNPKLLTLNNQPALIFSGETIYYPVVSGGSSASATTGATNPSVISTPLPVGVTLDITPEIIDSDSVILKVNPSASSCVGAACELQRVSVGGVNYDIAPNVSQKQLSSVIKVKNGDRIILGGLIRDKNEQKSTKIPLLGDIPLLGYLFKQDSIVKSMEELVIIITPHIVKDDTKISKNELGFEDK